MALTRGAVGLNIEFEITEDELARLTNKLVGATNELPHEITMRTMALRMKHAILLLIFSSTPETYDSIRC